MKKFIFTNQILFAVSIMILIQSGCTKIQTDSIKEESSQSVNALDVYRIEKSNAPITAEQAKNVAMLFNAKSPITKGNEAKEVKEVLTIKSREQTPQMYVVNYKGNKGFTIVGASRKYYPILAFVEKGTFDDRYKETGMDVWMDEQQVNIAYMEKQSDAITKKYSELWREYEKHPQSPYSLKTKTGDELIALRDSCINVWESQGYECYSLSECPDGLPESEYDNFCDIAESTANPNYDYLQNSIILVETNNFRNQVGPLLSTTWHQWTPYNLDIDLINGMRPPAGCIAIALSQIMRYHEWPNNYDWDNMLDFSYTVDSVAAVFIHEVGINANINYGSNGSNTSNSNALSALTNDYDYLATLVNHNNSLVYPSISEYGPIYMSGYSESSLFDWSGHAWVCDGAINGGSNKTYILKVISVVPPLQFESQGTYYGGSSYSYYNMVWGYLDSSFNGWFLGESVNMERGDFRYFRKDIIDISPDN